MRPLIRFIIIVALLWIGLLLSGYGVLFSSTHNAGGLGLQCSYLTAQGTSTAQYIHSNNGWFGLTNCPLLRKSTTVIDNG